MADLKSDLRPAQRYRFGVFEADAATGELRRQGMRVKLNAQPFQVLLMLLDRPGQLITRDEISRVLWPEGTFVDYGHGVNSAVNRIREALGDIAGSPRFVETLARRGYRFLAPVERISGRVDSGEAAQPAFNKSQTSASGNPASQTSPPETPSRTRILSTPEDLPKISFLVAQTLFVLFQLMYLGFYIGTLANLAEIEGLLAPVAGAALIFRVLFVTAAILIPARAFVLCAALFRAPGFRAKFLTLWPFLLFFDELWSLSPFLLLHHINFGLALASTALLVYSPFAQRSIVLMGAGCAPVEPR
ncbi:MAG TPA: winged helix-turn-helix domain-containing protein [Terracidiphilus sp.]|jgi:DNA-binding winged helix-turn-helix (wHTH) protein